MNRTQPIQEWVEVEQAVYRNLKHYGWPSDCMMLVRGKRRSWRVWLPSGDVPRAHVRGLATMIGGSYHWAHGMSLLRTMTAEERAAYLAVYLLQKGA